MVAVSIISSTDFSSPLLLDSENIHQFRNSRLDHAGFLCPLFDGTFREECYIPSSFPLTCAVLFMHTCTGIARNKPSGGMAWIHWLLRMLCQTVFAPQDTSRFQSKADANPSTEAKIWMLRPPPPPPFPYGDTSLLRGASTRLYPSIFPPSTT